MGLFINTLPVRVRVGDGGRGGERAARRTRCWPSCCATSTPRWRWRSAAARVEAPAPLFTALLNYRHGGGAARARPRPRRRAAGGCERLHGEERTNYPLTLSVDDLGERLRADGAGAAASVDAARVCALDAHARWRGWWRRWRRAPERALREHRRAARGRARAGCVEEWNAHGRGVSGASRASTSCSRRRRRARRTRWRVVFEGERADLRGAERAGQPAGAPPPRAGRGPGRARGASAWSAAWRWWSALLGVLKAGGAYVPLDPAYPAERLRVHAGATARPAAVLTQASRRAATRFAARGRAGAATGRGRAGVGGSAGDEPGARRRSRRTTWRTSSTPPAPRGGPRA